MSPTPENLYAYVTELVGLEAKKKPTNTDAIRHGQLYDLLPPLFSRDELIAYQAAAQAQYEKQVEEAREKLGVQFDKKTKEKDVTFEKLYKQKVDELEADYEEQVAQNRIDVRNELIDELRRNCSDAARGELEKILG